MAQETFNILKKKFGYFYYKGNLYAATGTPFYMVDKPEVLLEAADAEGNVYDAYFIRKKEYESQESPKTCAYMCLDIPWQKTVISFLPEKVIKTGREIIKEESTL